MLFVTTFWSFVREFSPVEMYPGEIKMAPIGRSRKPSDWVRSRGSNAATEPIWASPSLPLRVLPTCLVQLAIDTSNSQVGHEVARFTAELSASRVENWRGGGRYRGLTVAGGFRPVPVSQSDP